MLAHQFLEQAATNKHQKTALVCSNQRLTYQELNNLADRLATVLIENGIKRGDRVVIFLDNSVESVIGIFGVLKAGAVFIMPNATMKARKLNFILNDSGANMLITHTNKAKVVKSALEDAPTIKNVILDHDSNIHKLPKFQKAHSDFNTHSWPKLLKVTEPIIISKASRPIDVDLATIIYTSGSTGNPKGVMSAHYNVVSAVRSITQYLENHTNDVVLNSLPLSFDYGLYQVFMTFSFGGKLVLEKSFVYPYKVIEKIKQERITGFPIVPTMVALLLQMEDLSCFDFSSLRYISNTAAALPPAHIKKLRNLFPHITIYSMYGLTECKRVSYLPPKDIDRKPESVGIPMPNVEVMVLDKDGDEAQAGQIGELVVRGTNVMQGYWNLPVETARTFRNDQTTGGRCILYTGDWFKKDEEGYLYFVGRKDDLIKTKGERVSPKEIENVLCDYKGVQAAAVIGVSDPIDGNAIKAFIETTNGQKLNEKKLLRHCFESLEPFMIPKHIAFCQALPKLPNGKIDKNKLERRP
jgi:amino acid adenylation domain-containing protein